MLVVAVLAGCGAYKVASSPSSASAAPASDGEETIARTEVGCVEVGVDRRVDRELSPVVRYAVENHCAEPVTVDLAWASVIGRTADGAELALVPASTNAITRATIAPAARHEATLSYASSGSIGQLCVDVATIASVPDAVKATWRCFGNVISVTMR
ncbi:MAG: hypothetical protein AB7T06_07610 [Kofleriaceae bacterium]